METVNLPEDPDGVSKWVASVPREQAQAVLDAGFAECFGGYEREFNKGTGNWRWVKYRGDGSIETHMDKPQTIVGSGWAIASFLPTFMQQMQELHGQRFGWSIVEQPVTRQQEGQPDNPHACVYVVQIGAAHGPIGKAIVNELAIALAIAALNAIGFDPAYLHRELFPGERILNAANDARH